MYPGGAVGATWYRPRPPRLGAILTAPARNLASEGVATPPATPVAAGRTAAAEAPAPAADPGHRLQLQLWKRFHVRLTLIYGSAVFIVLAAMAVAFYVRGVRSALDNLAARLSGIAVALAQGIEEQQLAQLRGEPDRESATFKEILGRFEAIARNEPDIVSIYVLRPTADPKKLAFVIDWVPAGRKKAAAKIGQLYDVELAPLMLQGLKEPVVESEPSTDEWGEALSGYAPIPDAQGRSIGIIGLDVDAAGVREMKLHVLSVSAALFGVAALFLLGAAVVVARNVREPLTKIIDATAAIAAGQLETRAGLQRDDEFGILGHHFDEMAKGLQERELIRSTFGRYVSEDVARRVLSSKDAARLGGEEREVTVLFSDLRGYSTISETLGPQEVIGFLNEYLASMNEVIDAHGGCIIEFLGDAILAVFGAPDDMENHPERAVRCAMAMREALAAFNRKVDAEGRAPWKSKGIAALGQRIGIHTGQVVAGNLGSRTRVKYAVIGDAVNVASRVEGLNKQLGTEILLTASTHERLGAELRDKVQERGAHPVKGRAQSVLVFAV